MQHITEVINRVAIGLACFITLGILVHDTKFDKAVSLALPFSAVTFGFAASQAFDQRDGAHTHVERVHLNHALSHMPRTKPRKSDRKYLLNKGMSQDSDQFGGSRILWPSV